MSRRMLRNPSLFRIHVKHQSFAIFRMFAYTVGLVVTQSKNLDFCELQGAQAKTLCAKLRTIANDSKSGQEREPEMSTSFLCSNRPSDGR